MPTGLASPVRPHGTDAAGSPVTLIKKVAKAGTNNANGLGDGAPNKAVEIQSVSIG